MYEFAQLTRFGKPDYGVDVIWHHDESNATRILQPKLLIENSKQNFFRIVVVKQVSPAIAGKSHKMCPQFIVENSALVRHAQDCTDTSCCCAAPIKESVLPSQSPLQQLIECGGTGSRTGAAQRQEVAPESVEAVGAEPLSRAYAAWHCFRDTT